MRHATLMIASVLIFAAGAAHGQSGGSVEIVNDRFGIQLQENGALTFVIGEIQNDGDATLDSMVIEARFFDVDGLLIDVTVERLYSVTLPPGETAAFRLQGFAMDEPDAYASHAVRLLSFEESRPCSGTSSAPSAGRSGSGSDVIKRLLISSFPILLLIGAWVFFMRRMGGKNSPQKRTLDLIEEQNEMLKGQKGAIERIAKALEVNKSS